MFMSLSAEEQEEEEEEQLEEDDKEEEAEPIQPKQEELSEEEKEWRLNAKTRLDFQVTFSVFGGDPNGVRTIPSWTIAAAPPPPPFFSSTGHRPASLCHGPSSIRQCINFFFEHLL